MGKLQKAWEVVGTLIKNPQAISQVLKDEELGRKQVQEVHGLAQGLPTVDLLELFPDFEVTVDPYSFLEGTSTVLDIALLNALARSFEDCHYLEIGTWRGESVANVARFATKCVSVSLSEAELRQFGFDEAFIRVHQRFSAGLGNVQHIGHNSRTFDFAALPERFDLTFVDGDHSYEAIKADTRSAFTMRRNERSVIVWHDYGSTTERVRWNTLAGILDGCPAELRGHLYHVSNTLCAVYLPPAYAKIGETRYTSFPAWPNKRFQVTVSAQKI